MSLTRADYQSLADFLQTTVTTAALPILLPEAIRQHREGADEALAVRDRIGGVADAEIKRRQAQRDSIHTEITPQDIEPLVEALKQLGIRNIATPEDNSWEAGRFAVVIPFTDKKQLLRISVLKDEDRAYDNPPPMMLKPIKSFCVGKFRIEIFPEVKTGPDHVKAAHLRFLNNLAGACGYLFWDIGERNVGILENGMPVILDPGSVCDFEHLRTPLNIHALHALPLPPESKRETLTLGRYIKNKMTALEKLDMEQITLYDDLLSRLTGGDASPQSAIEKATGDFGHWLWIMASAYAQGSSMNFDDAIAYAQSNGSGVKHMDGFLHHQQAHQGMRQPLENFYAAQQQEHMDTLGLKYDEVVGVFDEKALQHYFERTSDGTPRTSKLANIIRGYGLDKKSLGHASLKAAEEYMKPETPKDTKWADIVEDKVIRTGTIIEPGDL